LSNDNQDNNEHDSNAKDGENPGVILPPPLILLAFLVTGAILQFLVPVTFLAPFAWWNSQFLLGSAISLAAFGLAIWGVRIFSAAGTNVATHKAALKVVKGGPYRFTRNPMYMGMQLLLIGVGIMFSAEWNLILWPLFFAILKYGVVLREERYMRNKFGDEYIDLLKRTRRWL